MRELCYDCREPVGRPFWESLGEGRGGRWTPRFIIRAYGRRVCQKCAHENSPSPQIATVDSIRRALTKPAASGVPSDDPRMLPIDDSGSLAAGAVGATVRLKLATGRYPTAIEVQEAKDSDDLMLLGADRVLYADADTRAARERRGHVFTRVTDAVAALSTQPGGVTFAGVHYETRPASEAPNS